MFSFMASYLLFKKQKFGERKRYDPWKISKKKKKKMLKKKVIILNSNLNRIFGLENVEIWFSLFLEKL